jgi:hypothetical protein
MQIVPCQQPRPSSWMPYERQLEWAQFRPEGIASHKCLLLMAHSPKTPPLHPRWHNPHLLSIMFFQIFFYSLTCETFNFQLVGLKWWLRTRLISSGRLIWQNSTSIDKFVWLSFVSVPPLAKWVVESLPQ